MEKNETKLFLTIIFVYLFFVQWYGWNEQSYLSLTRAIVDEKRFEIDSYANQTGDRSFFKNHYYTDKNPGLSFLASPVYLTWSFLYNFFPQDFKQNYSGDNRFTIELQDTVAISTYIDPGFFIFYTMIFLTFFLSSIFSALTTVLIYKTSKRFTTEKYSLLVALGYWIGTIAFINALHFMSHSLATFLSFFSFFVLFTQKDAELKKFGLAGILAGFAIVVDQLNLLIALPLLFYAFYVNKKKSTFFLLGLVIGVMPLLIYNFLNFGHPLSLALIHIDRNIFKTANPETFSFSGKNLEKKFSEASFDLTGIFKIFHFNPNSNPYVMLRLLFYPYRGLFIYSPILFLSFIGMILMLKEHRTELILILFIFFSFLYIISMRSSWWGGYCFGPRYLLPVVPFLTFPIALIFKKNISKLFLILILSLFLISIFISSLGLQPAEEDIYDWRMMGVKNEDLINSFQVMLNPLEYHYFPNFLKYGPRSWVFESLTNGFISIDIRVNPISKGSNFPFSKFFIPFLCLVPIFFVVLVLWSREIFDATKKIFKVIKR
jgi:4-amino-4-deoxy-L-arabinose transferase-like glycosyltransferase